MSRRNSAAPDLFDKIRQLPPDKIAEVEDFVEFLRLRIGEQKAAVAEAAAVTRLSEQAFAKLWDNPDDAEYDKL
jgi:hypothetical protein